MGKRNAKLKPIHPGIVLKKELMEPRKLSANRLALDLRVPVTRVAEIVHGRRNITADTAYRLGLYFGMGAEFWLNLQNRYDLETLEDSTAAKIRAEVRPHAA